MAWTSNKYFLSFSLRILIYLILLDAASASLLGTISLIF